MSPTAGGLVQHWHWFSISQDPLFIMDTRVAWTDRVRFGVEITRMDLRERNRLRYFLLAHRQPCS